MTKRISTSKRITTRVGEGSNGNYDVNQDTSPAAITFGDTSDIIESERLIAVPPMAVVYTDIVSFLRILVLNSWIILIFVILGAGVSYLYYTTEPRIYQSVGTVIVVPQTNDVNRTGHDAYRTLSLNPVGNYLPIFRSRVVTEAAYEMLEDTYDRETLASAEIIIAPISNSSVITVDVRSTDPVMSRDLANALVNAAVAHTPAGFSELYPLEVLDVANEPEGSIYPSLRMILLLGIAGSAAIGIAVAFLFDNYRQYRKARRAYAGGI